jgi:transposase
MGWKVNSVVETRFEFVSRLLDGEKMSDLCREFSISRKTGYKFLERYQSCGKSGLEDISRAPLRIARKTSDEIEKLITDLRLKRPTWGSQKLREYLIRKEPGIKLPSPSTITEILHRNGLIQEPKKRDYVYSPTKLNRKNLNRKTQEQSSVKHNETLSVGGDWVLL